VLRHLNCRPVAPPWPPALAAALAEERTFILLVFGSGPGPDTTERRCRALAANPGFETLRVVRLEDRAALADTMPAAWLAPGRQAALLGPDRRLALPIDAPSAVDLFVAVAALT
jgi:hypothetical protein